MGNAKISMLQYNVITTDKAFEEFVAICKGKNLSPATIRNYNFQWTQFIRWFTGDTVQEITQDTLTAYIRHLQACIKPESINTALRHLRAIFNYFVGEGYMQPVKVGLLKVETELKDTYTDTELSILLRKPDMKKVSFPMFRTWAAINFLVGVGCRARSLVNVKIQDIDFENRLITLTTTKNRKAQVLPMGDSLSQVIKAYLKVRQGTPQDYLFPSETNSRLLETSLYHNIEEYNLSRGINKKGVHLFRFTFAKHFIMQGGDILRLQRILGHQSIAMSQHYAQVFGADLKGTEQFNLLENITTKQERITMAAKR
ncbi:tyrosine recombinase XerD [Ruminiclostridium hungatei]|uniref:Tyrosine recombinase XerD n=1 Tax=Ruminiclostridium hungatei TaxID=48256 RepID=A0A1V4SI28_RUMHU|nr:tyrosine-type recombinase/integrase [Ruminiclostridium hungatei]OPX43539.1 tyrosine recombinase XerD [Ruminiclostridium hungatei]